MVNVESKKKKKSIFLIMNNAQENKTAVFLQVIRIRPETAAEV